MKFKPIYGDKFGEFSNDNIQKFESYELNKTYWIILFSIIIYYKHIRFKESF